ncbi:hypothetical protein P280DRAFT_465074 [Massarina eburnea CBS 473.64]|uniref:Uncharacterized protein n=1 Tax=Massarina eburnea CBS 473.64 TaxID=1395130 RepID=A0A6A6SGL0_9PLEO|nr:hypothetical protein P280DRAFT_465074 [Massarina eburnea CBS 473.64]
MNTLISASCILAIPPSNLTGVSSSEDFFPERNRNLTLQHPVYVVHTSFIDEFVDGAAVIGLNDCAFVDFEGGNRAVWIRSF